MVRWLASPDLEINLAADFTDDNSEVQADTLLGVGVLIAPTPAAPRGQFVMNPAPGSAVGIPQGIVNRNNSVNLPAFGVPYDSRFVTGNPYTAYQTYMDLVGNRTFPPVSTVESWGVSATIDYDPTDAVHVKWINAYRAYDANFTTDNDFSPLHLNLVNTLQDHEQFTSELQVSGQLLRNALDWTAGAFYFDSDSFNGGRVISANGVLDFNVNDYVDSSDKSAFVHLVYHATEQLSFTGGGRYSDVQKSYAFDHLPFLLIPQPIPANLRRFDWKLGADYKFTDDLMVYSQVATGFRSPGFNPRPFTARQLVPIPEESLKAYELGLKSSLLDGRVRLNLAAFYSDFGNRVITRNGTECLDPGAPIELTPPACSQVTSRVLFVNGPANVRGVELELLAEPIDELTLDATFGYNAFSADDLTIMGIERKLPGIPERTASVGAQYRFALGASGFITPRADAYYQSIVYFETNNLPIVSQPGYTIVNARLTYETNDRNWAIALLATNIADKYYHLTMTDAVTTAQGALSAQPGRPREWALTVRRRF
jgi:iron complex outermembrane receptor protein